MTETVTINQELVEFFEGLAELARNGEVAHFVGAIWRDDQTVASCVDHIGNPFQALGAVELLKVDIIDRWFD